MTSASVKSIMSQRTLIPTSSVGKRVKVSVQGNGNTIDVKDSEGEFVQSATEPGTVLQKRIFNCKANSQLAMLNTRNRETLQAALKAEKDGNLDKASELFSEYLNKTQVSFGVLLPSATAGKLSNNVEIAAEVQEITTEKGSLLTLNPSTISIVEPEAFGKTVFNLADYEEAPAETVDANVETEA